MISSLWSVSVSVRSFSTRGIVSLIQNSSSIFNRFSSTSTTLTAPVTQAKAQEKHHPNEKMIILNLVRHGETEMNKADIVQSRTPGDLTKRGIEMAENLGKVLKNEKFYRVYTSDLKRCHDTTLNILKHNNDPPEPILKPILRERDYGDLEFKPNSTVRDLMKRHGLPNHAVPIPGAESHEEVMRRCAVFFDEICQLADEVTDSRNVLAVSHGAWILSFLDYLTQNSHAYELKDYVHEPPEKRPILNTGHTKLRIGKLPAKTNNNTKRPIQFVHVHCVKHLSGMI